MLAYWEFINRNLSEHTEVSVFSKCDNFYYKSFMWGLYFSVSYSLIDYTIRSVFPRWYHSLEEKKRKELAPNCACMVHHAVVASWSIYHILLDYFKTDEELRETNYSELYAVIVPFTFGYFIGDTVMFAIPEMFKNHFEYVIHHIFSISITLSIITITGPAIRFIPHTLIIEVSSLLFAFTSVLRAVGLRGSIIVSICEYLFAITFFLGRIVHMPIFLTLNWSALEAMGLFRYLFIPIMVMQFYWFYKIVAVLVNRGSKSTSDEAVKEKSASSKKKI